jgi:hypothetical protein
MRNLKTTVAVLSLLAALLFASPASGQITETFFAAGSSAQWNTIALAAGLNIYGGGPLCGTHHWSNKSTTANPIVLVDPRNASIPKEPGNLWVVWNDAAANGTSGGSICYMLTVDSIVGVRTYQAGAYLSVDPFWNGSADGNVVPLLGTGEALNGNVFAFINLSTSKLNAGVTDIRPDDAKLATMRALTGYGANMTGRSLTGLGYGPGPIGTAIASSQTTTGVANPINFVMDSRGVPDTDEFTGATPREYLELNMGAAPVMVIANVSNTTVGHLGDASNNFRNVNRFVLADILAGNNYHIRNIAASGITNEVMATQATTSIPDNPIHTFIRENLSGTYNTMEFCLTNSAEIAGDEAFGSNPGQVFGMDRNINPGNVACAGLQPCAVESGNPLWHKALGTAATGYPNGGTRGRVIGTSEMITAVNGTADGFGYAFWGFSSYDSKANIKYLTVDGVDPLYAAANLNPGGPGFLPQCTKNGAGQVISCPQLPFTNIVNGSYPIWSKYRTIYDPTDSTNLAPYVIQYAQEAANVGGIYPGSGILTDFVPASKMEVFRSHYAQQVRDAGGGIAGYNGLQLNIPETGGDEGGAVLTINSEIDYQNDTAGNQQVNKKQ